MVFVDVYCNQVVFLICVLFLVVVEECFVMKGGMVINFFICDLLWFLVDIDFIYLLV